MKQLFDSLFSVIQSMLNKNLLIILLGGIIVSLLTFIVLRDGIRTYSDSWAYWEGSVCLLENNTYTYFGGEPIVSWPPLYSIYLATMQNLLGQTGFALISATALLSFLNSIIWGYVSLSLVRSIVPHKCRVTLLLCMLFIGVFLIFCSRLLMAHYLSLFMTGLFLMQTLMVCEGELNKRYWQNLFVLGIIGAFAC